MLNPRCSTTFGLDPKCFWYDNRDFGDRETTFQVVPDGYAEIIFYFGNLQMVPDDGNLMQLPSPFMMGLLDRPAVFQTRNRLEIMGVRCFPWTVSDLLGLSSGKGGVHVFVHPIAELQSALSGLMASGKIDEVLARLKDYFTQMHSQVTVDKTLFKAGAVMIGSNGTTPVGQVAAAAHATVRTLERKFKQSSGFTVKDVSGLIRFEQVRNKLWNDPDANLAGLAHELGYADQAHLTREFKKYSGTTPAAFARTTKKRKLALGNDFVAFVQA
ncbi:Helix-turn-helix domain-containing protein [Dyadobacter soli]|uniref:Helix-turn-helix domain-containing protein n=1 Tax=Dyadobacter soli TaxID=659014 RepID=A0A1G7ZSX7_9BACT|nr:helix-turn-helix domain-containing protein [Dyadobacter soli]SDH11802.1 Helix-turn-helix domain-containing protein [Dyadobacter soli]